MTPRVRSSLSRRAFLAAGGLTAAALASGCGAVDDLLSDGDESARSPQSTSPDEQLVADALTDQEHLLALCLAVRARHKSVRETIAPLLEHHREHVRVLGGDPSSVDAQPGVSTSQTKSLATLRRKEKAAAKRRARDAQRADSGELARVLAAVAASQLQHEYVLDGAIGNHS